MATKYVLSGLLGAAVFAVFLWWPTLVAFAFAALCALSGIFLAATPLVILAPFAFASALTRKVGRWVEARASSPGTLIAARRLATDQRGVGRLGAAIGAVAVGVGMAAVVMADSWLVPATSDPAQWLRVCVIVLSAVVGAAIVVGLLIGVLGLRAQGVGDKRTVMSDALGGGVSKKVLRQAQCRENLLVMAPMAVIGVLFGSVSWVGVLLDSSGGLLVREVLWVVGIDVAAIVVVSLGAGFGSLLISRWAGRAGSAGVVELRRPDGQRRGARLAVNRSVPRGRSWSSKDQGPDSRASAAQGENGWAA